MRITILGAAGEVTGSGYLVETAKSRVLVDFGLFRGAARATARTASLAPWIPRASTPWC